MKKLLLILLCIPLIGIGQSNKYQIQGEIVGLKDTTLILGFYTGNKFGETGGFAADTAYSKNGKFIFQGKEKLKGGLYFIIIPEQQPLELIISEQKFSFKTEFKNLLNITFYKSKENPPFYEYVRFMQEIKREAAPISTSLKASKGAEKKKLENKLQEITKKVDTHKKNFIKKYPNMFFTKLIKIPSNINDIEIPESPLDSTGNPDKFFPFQYYKKHFWDNIDFTDSRMIRTRVFHNKLKEFFEQLTVKHPDSIKLSADIIAKKAEVNNEIFKYIVHGITAKYEQPEIMGMQDVFVHMVENYYMQERCDWVNEEQLNKMIERAEKWAPNMLGKKAPEFIDQIGRPFMKDTLGNLFTLANIKTDYLLLLFYSPDCGHCKKTIPKIQSIYDSLIRKKIDIKVFAVNNGFNKNEWIEFIRKYNTEDWINVGDQPFTMKQNFIYKKQEGNLITLISKDKKENYKKLKKIEIETSLRNLVDDKNILNIELFKKMKPEYEDATFILNKNNKFICEEEKTPRASSNWREKYDINTTPMMYLLNKNKEIIGREVHYSQISKIVGRQKRK